MFASQNTGVNYIDRGFINTFDYDENDFILDWAWYELDLSSIIGTGKKLVNIKVYIKCAYKTREFAVKTPGNDTTKNYGNVYSGSANEKNEGNVLVLTDGAGKIDYTTSAEAGDTIQVFIRGWFVV